MGCKAGVFLKAIPKALEKGAQYGSELIKSAEKELEHGKLPLNPKKPFAEALLCLLDQKKIRIEGYDMDHDISRLRKQSFKPDGFIFSLIKTEPFDIRRVIIRLDDVDGEKSEKAYLELKNLFIKKLEEIEEFNFKNWNVLNKKVEVRKPTEEEILWHEASEQVNDEARKDDDLANLYSSMDNYYEAIRRKKESLEKAELKEKYEFLYVLNIPESEFLNPANEPDDYFRAVLESNPKPKSITEKYLFSNTQINESEFLNEMDYKTPLKRSHNNKDELFKDIISYVQAQEHGNNLINKFAKGLSDKKDSKELLEELVEEATGKEETLIYSYSI